MLYLVINKETEDIVSEWSTQKLAEDSARTLNGAFDDSPYYVQPTCPQCDGDDVSHLHHPAVDDAVPETDYWRCNDCRHQWGHE